MELTFTKNYSIGRVNLPTPQHPEGDPEKTGMGIAAQDGSTFDRDTILVGKLEERYASDWQPVQGYRAGRYNYDHVKQPLHQIGTWRDRNLNGKIEEAEVRTFNDRIGDVNHNEANSYDSVTLDLRLSEGNNGTWYVREDLGILRS